MRRRFFIPRDTVLMALDNVRSHKLRSVLTVLGVVIGVLVVVVIASILTGMRKSVIEMVEEYGTSNIFAFHLSTGPRVGPRDRREYARRPLRPEDGEAIEELSGAVQDVAHVGFVWLPDRTLAYGPNKYKRAEINAASANYLLVTNLSVAEGRGLTEADDHGRREVMLIGATVREALFPHRRSVVGSEVAFAGRLFTVVGVLGKRKGGFLGENEEDNVVIIPYRTARRLMPRTSEWLLLVIRARSGQLQAALDQVEEVLRRRRGVRSGQPNNFDLSTAQQMIQQFDSITATIGLVAIAISSVGLLVGGIGVMNIMLVSVTERTQEIGVRKALGARRRDIVTQFLFEAMTLTFTGGVLGVLLSILTSRLIAFFVPTLPAEIPAWAVVAGLAVSVGVGLAFGVWPAQKAARLDPVEALRYE